MFVWLFQGIADGNDKNNVLYEATEVMMGLQQPSNDMKIPLIATSLPCSLETSPPNALLPVMVTLLVRNRIAPANIGTTRVQE